MLQILSDIMQQLRELGYDVRGRIGARWLTSQNSDMDGIIFMFDPMQYAGDDKEEAHRLKYLIGSPTLQDAGDTAQTIPVIQAIETVHRKFLQLLRNYENANEQQVITITGQSTVTQYFDFTFLEICTSGIMCETPVTLQITDQC